MFVDDTPQVAWPRPRVSAETKSLLEELAKLLDQLPEDRFDYGTWVGEDWEGDPGLSCGTVACAVGWATTLPSFRARGLRLNSDTQVPELQDHSPFHRGLRAMTSLLDIDEQDAAFLFMPNSSGLGSNASAKEVAAHIRRWIESNR